MVGVEKINSNGWNRKREERRVKGIRSRNREIGSWVLLCLYHHCLSCKSNVPPSPINIIPTGTLSCLWALSFPFFHFPEKLNSKFSFFRVLCVSLSASACEKERLTCRLRQYLSTVSIPELDQTTPALPSQSLLFSLTKI